jgi:formate-dependent nitrite reductase cytochrome c552 subunit
VQNLCSACHTDEQTTMAHSTHGISGVDCASCHMSEQAKGAADAAGSTKMTISNHTFAVASDVCTRCHTGSAHKSVGLTQTTGTTGASASIPVAELQSQRVEELEQQLNDAQKRTNDLRNVAVASMGLSLGVGGVVGLLVGVGATALLGRRKSQ